MPKDNIKIYEKYERDDKEHKYNNMFIIDTQLYLECIETRKKDLLKQPYKQPFIKSIEYDE